MHVLHVGYGDDADEQRKNGSTKENSERRTSFVQRLVQWWELRWRALTFSMNFLAI